MDALEYLVSVGGVARVGLLRANGYTPSAIRKLAAAGAHQPRKGIWALPSADTEYLTAILNNGQLTCASAAIRYGLWIKDKPGIPRAILESEISANCYGNARRLLAKADGLSESVPEISARGARDGGNPRRPGPRQALRALEQRGGCYG